MKYFTIKEMCRSSKATELGIQNKPTQAQEENLVRLIEQVLDPAREELGLPIAVSSGFRCQELNDAVGGAKTSEHLHGAAADLKCKDNAKLFAILRKQGVFRQLIWEFGNDRQPDWIHVSGPVFKNYNSPYPKQDVLRAIKKNGKTNYIRL